MFNLFTTRARKVIELGKTEAKRNGDDCVGTQHILYGLIREESGVGHHILEINGVTTNMIINESNKIVLKGDNIENPLFSPRAKKTFENAVDEATALGHSYVGTEHILLGLLKESESVAIQILTNFGLNIEQLRRETLSLLGFFDKDYRNLARRLILRFKPTDTDTNIQSVIIAEGGIEDVIGSYDTNTDELFFNRPLSIEEMQRIIRRIQND